VPNDELRLEWEAEDRLWVELTPEEAHAFRHHAAGNVVLRACNETHEGQVEQDDLSLAEWVEKLEGFDALITRWLGALRQLKEGSHRVDPGSVRAEPWLADAMAEIAASWRGTADEEAAMYGAEHVDSVACEGDASALESIAEKLAGVLDPSMGAV
jgi:hypothetical protein